MCDNCGCTLSSHLHHDEHFSVTPASPTAGGESLPIRVMRGLLEANDHQAHHNREHFAQHGVIAINLMSSPGAGKTALLEATIDALHDEIGMAVIEGDLETDRDAQRIRARGVAAIQITTGSACHLDARLVHHALHDLPLAGVKLLFIENVGNLVCPAAFDLGQHHNVILLAVTEGDDKPAKYPVIFRGADLVLLTKTDLLPHLDDFDPNHVAFHLRQLANAAPIFPLSAKSGEGMAAWLAWLRHLVEQPA